MRIIEAEGFPFNVDPDSSLPLWVQLSKRITQLIASGEFKPGDQLPKIRELAAAISINFNTVNKAYLNLASYGYVESIRGKGVFVCDLHNSAASEDAAQVEALLTECLRSCKSLGVSYAETARLMTVRARQLAIQESDAVQTGSNVYAIGVETAVEKKA